MAQESSLRSAWLNEVCDSACAGWHRTVSSRAGFDGSGSAASSERQIRHVCVLSARYGAESALRASTPTAILCPERRDPWTLQPEKDQLNQRARCRPRRPQEPERPEHSPRLRMPRRLKADAVNRRNLCVPWPLPPWAARKEVLQCRAWSARRKFEPALNAPRSNIESSLNVFEQQVLPVPSAFKVSVPRNA